MVATSNAAVASPDAAVALLHANAENEIAGVSPAQHPSQQQPGPQHGACRSATAAFGEAITECTM